MLLNRTLCLCREIKSHNETTETQWNGIDLSHLPVDFRSRAGPVQYVPIIGGTQNILEKLNFWVKMV